MSSEQILDSRGENKNHIARSPCCALLNIVLDLGIHF
jgi:hypothetical protein